MKERGTYCDGSAVRAILGGCTVLTLKGRGCLGVPGDRLWVRETFAFMWPRYCDDGFAYDSAHPDGRPLRDDECTIEYKADTGNPRPGDWPAEDAEGPRWRSPATMPRSASRITLEIVHVSRGGLIEFKRSDR